MVILQMGEVTLHEEASSASASMGKTAGKLHELMDFPRMEDNETFRNVSTN